MVSCKYFKDLRLEILRNLMRSQQKKSILQAGQPWNLLILILMALAQMPVKQMVVMLVAMVEGTWKGFCTRTKLVPSTEYSKQNSVMQLPLTDYSWIAQKVKGASLMDSPMNWEESAVAAFHPLPDDSLSVVSEQSWKLESKEELKKNLPSSEPGDRLLMQYLDCLTSIGVMEKLQLSLDPMRLRSCCFQAKHSPFFMVQPTLQTVQLEPLYCAHPAVQGKQIELNRKNLSEHLEQTPLVYSMHLPSCFQHWKKAFRKKPGAQDRHLSLSLSQVWRQVELSCEQTAFEVRVKPFLHSWQFPSASQERQSGLSISQDTPFLRWQPPLHCTHALFWMLLQFQRVQAPLETMKGLSHCRQPEALNWRQFLMMQRLATGLRTNGWVQNLHFPPQQMQPISLGWHFLWVSKKQVGKQLRHDPSSLQLPQLESSTTHLPLRSRNPCLQAVH